MDFYQTFLKTAGIKDLGLTLAETAGSLAGFALKCAIFALVFKLIIR